jgi:uncharacterized membrane protein YidH (DUF202 family)
MKQKYSKKNKSFKCFLLFLFLFLFPIISKASGYHNWDTQGGGGSETSIIPSGFNIILSKLFDIGIIVAAVLSVIMLTFGAIQYMGSESVFKKDMGREQMVYALGGLLLALASTLILSTILGGEGGSFVINFIGP